MEHSLPPMKPSLGTHKGTQVMQPHAVNRRPVRGTNQLTRRGRSWFWMIVAANAHQNRARSAVGTALAMSCRPRIAMCTLGAMPGPWAMIPEAGREAVVAMVGHRGEFSNVLGWCGVGALGWALGVHWDSRLRSGAPIPHPHFAHTPPPPSPSRSHDCFNAKPRPKDGLPPLWIPSPPSTAALDELDSHSPTIREGDELRDAKACGSGAGWTGGG
jgi:hypothetical protein